MVIVYSNIRILSIVFYSKIRISFELTFCVVNDIIAIYKYGRSENGLIRYKIDIFGELKKHGYNQTRIQKERLLPAQTAQNIKAGKSITLETLNKICIMCKLQPGDIVEVIPTDEEIIKYY